MPIAEYSLVAFDCPDPVALAEFYRQIVGGEIEVSHDDWVVLKLEGKADIAFQKVTNYQVPDWPDGTPQQAHMDFDVPDLDLGEEAVIAVGAIKADFQPTPESWRVFLDPVGHPFCLVLE